MEETVTQDQEQVKKEKPKTIKQKFVDMYGAAGKLQPEAKKILAYLWNRCKEDSGLCQDIMQDHKTWERMYKYVQNKAKEKLEKGSNSVCVDDATVYEWSEDYFRLDDKAQIEQELKEAEERKKKMEEDRKKREAAAKKRKEKAKKEAEQVKKDEKDGSNADSEPKSEPAQQVKKEEPKEIDGQMSLFDMSGIYGKAQ